MDMSLIQKIIIWAIPVLFAITIHEVAHGWVALKFGDKTALMMGRLTINPIKHIDPLGTILVPGVLLALGGIIFGWAKPVPVTPQNLRNPRRDMAIVAVAGPASNLLMAIFWAAIMKIGLLLGGESPRFAIPIIYMGQAGIFINLMLMVLNLVPLPPLDGGQFVSNLLPPKKAYYFDKIEPYGFLILLVLLATGILTKILGPIIFYLWHLLTIIFHLA
jgi:Zn-dependent protease